MIRKTIFSSTAIACLLCMTAAGSAFAATPPGPGVPPGPVPGVATTINQLHTISTVASTVDPTNGDLNPYAVAISPSGGLYVSNFSNSAGTNGAGTTIEHIVNGQPHTFWSSANGPAAMAFSPLGPLWVANFGLNGWDGNVQVIKPNGTPFTNSQGQVTGTIENPLLQGPWGQAFAGPYTTPTGVKVPPAFFVTSALNGSVEAMFGFSPPNFAADTHIVEIASGLAHSGSNANNISGPQGMAWDAWNHTLYVADSADNTIRAFAWMGANTPNQGQGSIVFQGAPLDMPAGLAIDPVNGDLLVVNQGNNDLIELHLPPAPPHIGAPGPQPPVPAPGMPMGPANPGRNAPAGPPQPPMPMANVVGVKVLDTGAPGALFGIAATTDASGNLVVYFTDDNTNQLDELSAN
ncbi:MAG: hypothetical protein OWT27_05980 [Firmicutes bacterium]|nr:hypothetical protein [Bacillota bacterium]